MNKILSILLVFTLFFPSLAFGSRWYRSSCVGNIDKIYRAIELHNVENQDIIKELPPGRYKFVLDSLIQNKYLTRSYDLPYCPEMRGTSYYGVGDLSCDGHLECFYHGNEHMKLHRTANKQTSYGSYGSYNVLSSLFGQSIIIGIALTLFVFIGIRIVEAIRKTDKSV